MDKKPLFYKSLGYSLKGMQWMLKNERNFRIELLALALNIFLCSVFSVSVMEMMIILLCCFLVLSAEIFNTAIEKLCNFVHPNFHVEIGVIKDLAAAAVVVLAILSVVVGVIIYWPYVRIWILY